MPAAQIQQERIEPSIAGERDGPHDRFRILLVADSAREHDEEFVAGQIKAPAHARAFVDVNRTELCDVNAVIQTRVMARAPLRHDITEIRSHGEASARETAVDGCQQPDERSAQPPCDRTNLPTFPPATEV